MSARRLPAGARKRYHTHILPSSAGSIFTVHPLLQNHSVTKPYRLSLPSLPFPPSLPRSASPSPRRLSLLLYVSMAERDRGQLRLVLSVRGILWKQYITGNSCQSTSPSICVSSPPSLQPLVLVLHVVIHSPHSCCIQSECRNLMVCHSLCIWRRSSLSLFPGHTRGCSIPPLVFFPKRIPVFHVFFARQRVDLVARPDEVAPFVLWIVQEDPCEHHMRQI